MGLCVFEEPDRPSLKRGIEYLVTTQNEEGSWSEPETTGTGFPRVFYLKYDMYRNAWPLLALATYRKLRETTSKSGNGQHKPAAEPRQAPIIAPTRVGV